jgi:tRNA U34 5-carboxymethylaminomethyl modifying GTPase MnmE/TrmE
MKKNLIKLEINNPKNVILNRSPLFKLQEFKSKNKSSIRSNQIDLNGNRKVSEQNDKLSLIKDNSIKNQEVKILKQQISNLFRKISENTLLFNEYQRNHEEYGEKIKDLVEKLNENQQNIYDVKRRLQENEFIHNLINELLKKNSKFCLEKTKIERESQEYRLKITEIYLQLNKY